MHEDVTSYPQMSRVSNLQQLHMVIILCITCR